MQPTVKQRETLEILHSMKSTHTTAQKLHHFRSRDLLEDLVSAYPFMESGIKLAFDHILKRIKYPH